MAHMLGRFDNRQFAFKGSTILLERNVYQSMESHALLELRLPLWTIFVVGI